MIKKLFLILNIFFIYFFFINTSQASLQEKIINKLTATKTLSFNFKQQISSKEEIGNFIDSLPISAMNEIREYFDTMPLVEYVVDYKCNEEGCGHENKISINGAEHFFV